MHKLVCSFLLALVGLTAQTKDDTVSRAMRDELQRSMKKLQLEQMQRPYFISYRIVESESKDANAVLGSLIHGNEDRSRILTVNVRVGDYALDNSNFFSFSFGNGVVFTGFQQLPLDDNYDELRRQIWLATDGAYKKALEDLSHKRAALENKHRTEEVPDFSKQSPTTIDDLGPRAEVSLPEASDLARRLSAVFRESTLVQTSHVDVNARNILERYLSSEGTSFTRRNGMVSIHVSGSAQAPDGLPLPGGFSVHAYAFKDLPPETTLAARIRDMLSRFQKLQSAPVAKEYNGPVLFEQQAAGEMVARIFAAQLPAEPRVISDNPQFAQAARGQQQESSLLTKMGARVMPDFLTLVDDPTVTQFNGEPLFGVYKVDEEGTPAQKKVIVENGILKTLLTSRAPVRGILQSTGNLRGAGVAPSNILLTSSKTVSPDELKKQLLDLVKTRNLDYGIIIRRMSNRAASLAYRVYPDGHEELIRNATVTGAGPAIFKDILAVSNTPTVYTETFTPPQRALPNFNTFFAAPTLVSFVVPSLLFEDLTIEQPSGEVPKPPVITNPLSL
jgi:predicted Zn-dependent protease